VRHLTDILSYRFGSLNMIPDVTPNGVFYLPPTGWLTSFYNPPFKFTPQIISKKLRHIFEETPADDQQAGLLTPQPAKQRQLFLKRAIKDKIKATFQLMPINNDGYPVNVTGNIAQLANSNRYLITNQNVSYVVNFDQIRYIANL
ncbi:hypothetical protein, partial [Limosilactobacillus reuteri]|uniref:hypothetical protein n=1 Tax=Limosilactobacillus reuteri TaxID=1598 RepID=UPI001CDC56CE